MFCDKSVNYYLFVIAIILAGKTWVQISPSIPFYRIKNIIKISKSNFGIYDKSFGKLLINQNSNFKIIKTDSVFKGKFKKAKISLKNINHSKTAMIFFTSGSTSEPKGVKISYYSFIYSAIQQVKKLSYKKILKL